MSDDLEFWFEYITRELYLLGKKVDAKLDPMLAKSFDFLKRIEAAMQKAASEDRNFFDCRLVDRKRRIAFRFANAEGRGFERTVPTRELPSRRNQAPPSLGEIVDLIIAMQSLIAGEPRRLAVLPLDFSGFRLLGAVVGRPVSN